MCFGKTSVAVLMVVFFMNVLYRGGVEKNCAHGKKLHTPPLPPSRRCLRKKSCPAIIVAFGKFFTQGQLLVQKWNSLHQISLCTLACTELFEPIDHFKFVLLVEVICEGAFFLLLGTNVGTRIEFFASN